MKLPVQVLAFVPVLFSGCANPTFSNQRQDFVPAGWSRVAIMPFAGDTRFTDAATQSFAIHILNVPEFRIIQPSSVSVSMRKLGIAPTENGFTVLEAQKVGRAIDAEAVIVGTVTSYNNGITLNGFCTAQIVDVASGEIVGASHHPSGLLIGNSEHHAVMSATERTGKEVLKMLEDLSRKNVRNTRSPADTDPKTRRL